MAKKGPRQNKRKTLSSIQKEKLAEFCANLAVAWLAAGIIGPYIVKEKLILATKPTIFSVIMAGILIIFMLSLVKEEK